MAEKIKAEEEPSIEEILDSIRQIISEDESSEEEDSSEPDISVLDEDFDDLDMEAEPETLDDVFELTERVVEAQAPPPSAPAAPPPAPPVSAPPPEPVPIMVDLIDESIQDEPEPVVEKPIKQAPPPTKEKVSAVIDPDPDSILTAAAENAAFSAMAELARKTAIEHQGITLEDIVRAELKPLLKAWLDKNLPIVIERLVREELERVSKRVLED